MQCISAQIALVGATRELGQNVRTHIASAVDKRGEDVGQQYEARKIADRRMLFLTLYSHVVPSLQREAAKEMGAALFG